METRNGPPYSYDCSLHIATYSSEHHTPQLVTAPEAGHTKLNKKCFDNYFLCEPESPYFRLIYNPTYMAKCVAIEIVYDQNLQCCGKSPDSQQCTVCSVRWHIFQAYAVHNKSAATVQNLINKSRR